MTTQLTNSVNARKPASLARNLQFVREEIELGQHVLMKAGQPDIAAKLQVALDMIAALKAPRVLAFGCWYCGGDVPADVPDLADDRMCRPCANAYDAALAERRRKQREARAAARALKAAA